MNRLTLLAGVLASGLVVGCGPMAITGASTAPSAQTLTVPATTVARGDIQQTVAELTAKGVEFSSGITDAGFGLLTSFKIPGGAELSLYQPKHPTAI